MMTTNTGRFRYVDQVRRIGCRCPHRRRLAVADRDRAGEYISLYWDDYEPEWYAVRGHVTPDQYAAEMAREPDIKLDTPRHTWAHWAMVGWKSRTDKRRNLMLCDKPGRGRFPVTVAERVLRRG